MLPWSENLAPLCLPAFLKGFISPELQKIPFVFSHLPLVPLNMAATDDVHPIFTFNHLVYKMSKENVKNPLYNFQENHVTSSLWFFCSTTSPKREDSSLTIISEKGKRQILTLEHWNQQIFDI